MRTKHKQSSIIYFMCGLLLAPMEVYGQSEISGVTALSTIGAFLICLFLFFLLIQLNSNSSDQLPKTKNGEKKSMVSLSIRAISPVKYFRTMKENLIAHPETHPCTIFRQFRPVRKGIENMLVLPEKEQFF